MIFWVKFNLVIFSLFRPSSFFSLQALDYFNTFERGYQIVHSHKDTFIKKLSLHLLGTHSLSLV
jgi:hypothetical protein